MNPRNLLPPQGVTRRWNETHDFAQRLRRAQARLAEERRVTLIGEGPAFASAIPTIERQPFVWDTNGFYRSLGLDTDAKRVEIAHAYINTDGYRSAYLTAAAKTLLDKDTRRAYDALPLGTLWSRDPQINQAMADEGFREQYQIERPQWAYYSAVGEIAGALARPADEWWAGVASALSHLGYGGMFALGVAEEGAVAQVGYGFVAFIPLRLAPTFDPVYASQIASRLIEVGASPT